MSRRLKMACCDDDDDLGGKHDKTLHYKSALPSRSFFNASSISGQGVRSEGLSKTRVPYLTLLPQNRLSFKFASLNIFWSPDPFVRIISRLQLTFLFMLPCLVSATQSFLLLRCWSTYKAKHVHPAVEKDIVVVTCYICHGVEWNTRQ